MTPATIRSRCVRRIGWLNVLNVDSCGDPYALSRDECIPGREWWLNEENRIRKMKKSDNSYKSLFRGGECEM